MALLADLVRFPSVSSGPVVELVDFISNRLDHPRIALHRLPAGAEGKLNLVALTGPSRDDRAGLTLCGHLDVVPPGEGWTSDPFALAVRGERLVGRGTADMKGSVAIALNRFIRAAGTRLQAPLALLLTCDEEVGALGARHLALNWPGNLVLPKATLIGEPTSLMVVHAHKGHVRLRITLSGVPAHSGLPHLGRNAIEPAGAVIVALAGLRRELEAERVPSSSAFPEVPFVVLNIARVRGGAAFNMVPDHCEIDLGVRTLPGVSVDALAARIRDAVAAAAGSAPSTVEFLGENPPMQARPDALLHAWLSHELGQAGPRSVAFASDAGWLTRAGLECLLFGPGSIDDAHKPDEFVPLREFERAGAVVATAVAHFTGMATG